jgi:phosphoglycerate dehydrogenase-like enzyme
MTGGVRKVLLDVRARQSAFRVTDEALSVIAEEASSGWSLYVSDNETSSDGDGGTTPNPEVLREIADAEVYFGFGITRELFRAAPRLKWVHSASAGVGGLLYDEMVASAAMLTNSAGVYAPAIAEHVLGGVLYFLRSFDVAAGAQLAGRWEKSAFTGRESRVREMSECQVLIVGVGGIGSEIAVRMTALGARCVGVRRRPGLGTPAGFLRVAGTEQLNDELPAADVVVLAAPGTAETASLLNRERIALLRRGAIVVNVARGTLLDTHALADALTDGRIRGAFLDVFSTEPLPPQDPLWRQRGVFISPHVSGVSPASFWKRQAALFVDNWRRYKSGEPLRNLVDKQAGY